MLRLLAGLSLVSSAVSVAQTAQPVAPVTPTAIPAPQAAVPAPAPAAVEAPPVAEEPAMKKVCHLEDVAGSAFPRRVCKMKPIKPKDAM